MNGVRAADALRRYRPDHYERALNEAYDASVEPSRHLRGVIREVDQDVCKTLAFEARRLGLHGTARGLRMLPRLDIGETELVTLAEPAPPGKPRRPSLDELRARHPDFSDDELAAWRDDEYPSQDFAPDSALPSPALPAAATISPKYTPVPARADRKQRVVRLARTCLERLRAPRPTRSVLDSPCSSPCRTRATAVRTPCSIGGACRQ